MTTVTTATSPPQASVYPQQQQQPVYPPQTQQQVYRPQQQQPQMYPATGYVQAGYPAQPVTFIQIPPGQTTTTTSSSGQRYNKKAALATGILQIIAGAFAAILGIVLLVIGTWYPVSWNIWGGIGFYIVTGILGVVSKNQNKCLIIAYMVMCIISAVCAGSQLIYDSVAAVNSRHLNIDYCGLNYYYNNEKCPRLKAIVALHSISALTGLGEMVVAIIASAFCCHGLCSGSTPTQSMVVTYAQAAPAGMTVVAPVSYAPAPGAFQQGQPPVNVQGQPPAYAQLQQQPPFPEQPLMQEEPK